MKLNNKGFAITAVLYGLLILFVILIGSYLTLLGTKKSRIYTVTSDIEKDYEFNKEITNPIQPNYPYDAPYTGKYIFENNVDIHHVSYNYFLMYLHHNDNSFVYDIIF